MIKQNYAIIDGKRVAIEDEKNLLELIRKAKIELPTFCYHSEISVYGACRMCMVEVEGMGLVPACSTKTRDGMVVHTDTKQIRKLRRMIVELMLANHDDNCTTCPKSGSCRLQRIARQLGVDKIRFKKNEKRLPVDASSSAIVHDPNKCVLCGDCVRVCSEIQGIGVLDFAHRGAATTVVASCEKELGAVECVNCGQCIKVCPVGALTPKLQVSPVWDAIYDEKKTVVVQIAPAVRVALGEEFGYDPGTGSSGKMVAALRMIGFDQVYDTSFAADLTVIEEGNEFLARYEQGKDLPQFTSCCPAWVKFAEQYYPDILGNMSSCRSPQQMFGSLCKDYLPAQLGIKREDLVVVSIMPCSAKKFEAQRPEFAKDGDPDVDYVLTTTELAMMIRERGVNYAKLDPSSFDMPLGFKTGAGVIFGNSGGVSEAVLRYAAHALGAASLDCTPLRSGDGTRVAEIPIGEVTLRLAVVSGLANARRLMDRIRNGEEHYDLVEVMACCGGCVNGGGQPLTDESALVVAERTRNLRDIDTMLQFHSSQENPYLQKIYDESLQGDKPHHLLHTSYQNRRRIERDELMLSESSGSDSKLKLHVCFGTSCFLRGSLDLYKSLMAYLEDQGLKDITEVKASFCTERCKRGPLLTVNGKPIEHCTLTLAVNEINAALARK